MQISNGVNKGFITTYVLVFGAAFLILLAGLLGFILLQLRQSNQKVAWNESLYVAEAGINYYQWCLNNGVEDNCSVEKEVLDSVGNVMGTFSLLIDEGISCGEVITRTIESSGHSYKFPDVKRKVRVVYGRESVAKYAYLLNDDVWIGADHEIRGLYQSNGGIRMDGENQSIVASAKTEWICTSSFGCNPPQVKPGVFTSTSNGNPDLFSFPVPSFDFDGITIDLAKIKSLVWPFPRQYYWPPVTDINSQGKGYHLILKDNGTFEVWIITGLQGTWACHIPCDSGDDYYYDYFTITSEYRFGEPISIDPECSLIFVEDNLWLEGEVKGMVTVAAANLISPSQEVDVVLPNSINYTTLDGSGGLAVVAERNILVGPQSPSQIELRGVFIAQKGYFGRNYYQNNIRDKLEIRGSIISNGRVGTQWISGGQIVSGYRNRESYFDANLVYQPPYFVPYITPDFKIIDWEEIN